MQDEADIQTGPALSVYRRLAAALFERAIEESGLTPTELRLALRDRLLRPTLTAPTVRAWRRGNKAVPAAAILAMCELCGKTLVELKGMLRADAPGMDAEARDLLRRL